VATPEKVATIEKAREWYEQSSGLIFTDYRGLTVGEMQELRRSLRAVGAEFHVVKNTLFRRAVGEDIAKMPDELHNGTTATVFIFAEQPACAKAVATFSKAHAALQIKGGFIEGRALTAKEIDELSKLPSRHELLSMIVGLVAAPMSQVVGTIQEILAAPIRVIDAIAEKAGGAPPAAAPAEPAASAAPAEPAEAPAEAVAETEASATEAAQEPEPEAAAEASAQPTEEPQTESTEGES
jgi:large subunit ribosomal protein L10